MGITVFESNIRTLLHFINENAYLKQIIKEINTGANRYTVICEFVPSVGIKYYVNKRNTYGKDLGTIEIDRVSVYGLEYSNILFSLPNSAVKCIRQHYTEIVHRTNRLGAI